MFKLKLIFIIKNNIIWTSLTYSTDDYNNKKDNYIDVNIGNAHNLFEILL